MVYIQNIWSTSKSCLNSFFHLSWMTFCEAGLFSAPQTQDPLTSTGLLNCFLKESLFSPLLSTQHVLIPLQFHAAFPQECSHFIFELFAEAMSCTEDTLSPIDYKLIFGSAYICQPSIILRKHIGASVQKTGQTLRNIPCTVAMQLVQNGGTESLGLSPTSATCLIYNC